MNGPSPPNFGDHLVKGGIFFLGGISIMLSLSLIMAIFTPFPLSLANVLYGRTKGAILGLVCSILVLLLGWKVVYGPVILGIYVFSWIFSILISEIILRKKNPLKGFLYSGWFLVLFFGAFLSVKLVSLEGNLKSYLVKNAQILSTEIKKNQTRLDELKDEEVHDLLEVLSKPEAFADQIINFIPKAFFISVFFFFWVNLLLLLKAHHFYKNKVGYPYTEKELLRFKVPDFMIWPVISCLVIYLVGDSHVGPVLTYVSQNALYGFGLFYFFQGFGIYIDFLDSIKIFGFFRSLLVMFTVVSGYWMLVLIGLFDMWVNFRKFFKNIEN